MQKPQAIKLFDIAYLGSLLIELVGSVLASQYTLFVGIPALVLISAAMLAIFFVLPWYFASMRHGNGGKWTLTVFCGLGLVAMIWEYKGGMPHPHAANLGILIQLIGYVVQAFAVFQLFTPRGRSWFAQTPYSGYPYGAQPGSPPHGYSPQQGGLPGQQGFGQQPAYPPQPGNYPQQGYAPQQGYPGQQPGPQQDYPGQQAYFPQQGNPGQPTYPGQQGYPPPPYPPQP